jgi:rubrerythrin
MKEYPDNLKTEKQWKKLGYQLKGNAEEFKLWTNPHHHQLSSYYLREDVEPIKTELPWKSDGSITRKPNNDMGAYYCPSCGEWLNDLLKDTFCPICGQSLDWS